MSRDRARGVAKKGVALAVLATTSIAASLTPADAASAATTQSTRAHRGPAPAPRIQRARIQRAAYNVPAGCSQPDTSMVVTCTWSYTGSPVNFTVPSGVTQVALNVAGAQGATATAPLRAVPPAAAWERPL